MEDIERNDGSVDKPYFMNKELLKILGKRNDKYREIEANVKPADKRNKDDTTGVWTSSVTVIIRAVQG